MDKKTLFQWREIHAEDLRELGRLLKRFSAGAGRTQE